MKLRESDVARRPLNCVAGLACALPTLTKLRSLEVNLDKVKRFDSVDLSEADVLSICLALKAWPLAFLLDTDFGNNCEGLGSELKQCWRLLGLPAEAARWDTEHMLDYFREQQQKALVFANGLHARLGGASLVSQLDDNLVRMIVDELLGRSAFKTSQQQQHTRFQEVEDDGEMEEDQEGGGSDNDDDDDDDDDDEVFHSDVVRQCPNGQSKTASSIQRVGGQRQ